MTFHELTENCPSGFVTVKLPLKQLLVIKELMRRGTYDTMDWEEQQADYVYSRIENIIVRAWRKLGGAR